MKWIFFVVLSAPILACAGARADAPKVQLVSPDGAVVLHEFVEVRAQATSPSDNLLLTYDLVVDGKSVGDGSGPWRKVLDPVAGQIELSWDVSLVPGEHALQVKARTATATVESNVIKMKVRQPDSVSKRTLYLLSVGISKYPSTRVRKYGAADAAAFAKRLEVEAKALFKQIDSKILLNEAATRKEILDSFRWLRENAKPTDISVVFFSGFAELEPDGTYLYQSFESDAVTSNAQITGDEIKRLLTVIPGRTVLILDTNAAGAVFRRPKRLTDAQYELLLEDNGLIGLAGAGYREQAIEIDKDGHGLLTQSILEAFDGKGKQLNKGVLYWHQLDRYVAERVQALSSGRQTPTSVRPPSIPSFPIAKPLTEK